MPLSGHWQVNLIERATSGFPLYVVDSSDVSGTYFSYNGNTFQRPNEVGNPNVGWSRGRTYVIVLPRFTQFRSGLIPVRSRPRPLANWARQPRAPAYGPRFVNTDFSLIKDFPFTFRESMNLQFRAEFFNLFNHPQYFLQGAGGTGEQDINAPSSFGVINNTVNNPRLIQFALKLNF